MGHSSSPSLKNSLVEGAGLGCLTGLMHAMAETSLLAWNGVHPSGLDAALFGAISAAAGATLGSAAALALLTPPMRANLGLAEGPHAFRIAVWSALAGGYLLVFLKIVYFWSGWRGAVVWLLPAVPALALAAFAVFRKGQRALVALCAAALVAATLCALQLAHANWGPETAGAELLGFRLLTPIGVCLLALAVAGRKTPTGAPFEPIWKGAAALTFLVAAWAGSLAALDARVSFGTFFGGGPPPSNAARPNILLIVLDTVRADHLDLFGYKRETMPNLRGFALEECLAAKPMFTAGSWTLPSHASMFTGLYPSAHGAHYPFVNEENPEFLASPMRDDVPTLAEFLAGLGYQTAGIVANFGVLSHFGISRGFEEYTASPGPAYFAQRVLWFYRLSFRGWSAGEFLRASLPGGLQGHSRLLSQREPDTVRARNINARARQWIERHGSRPFFLFLNYMDAHDPYLPIPEDDERFMPRPPGDEWFGFPQQRLAESKRGAAKFTAGEIEFLEAQYDAQLVSLDREVGRLFDYLKQSGLYENTLILVTSDHGEAFFEHGFPDHGNSLFQPEVGGFLLIKAPASMVPVEVSPLMQHVDFFPTIAAVLNEPIPGEVQGRPWGAGRDYALSEVFCKSCGRELFESRWPDAMRHDLVAVMDGEQKFIRSTQGPDQVFRFVDDPSETQPVLDPDPKFLEQAEQAIEARNQHLIKTLSKRPEDKTLLEKLRSLGYIQ